MADLVQSTARAPQLLRLICRIASGLGGYALLGVVFELLRRVLEKRRALQLMTPTVRAPVLHWFWGYIVDIRKNALRRHNWSQELIAECDCSTVLIRGPWVAGPRQAGDQMCTQDPVNVKWVLKENSDNYTKSTRDTPLIVSMFHEFIGPGIFLLDHGPTAPDRGRAWAHQRKLASTIFSQGKFQTFYQEVFTRHGRKLVDQLAASCGKPVDLQDWFFKYTLDSFGELAFNTDLKTMTPEPDPFGTSFDEAHRLIFELFMESTQIHMALSLLPPGFRHLALMLFKARNAKYKAFRRHVDTLQRRVSEILQERRRDSELSKQKDLLALFMNSCDEQGRPYLAPSKSHDQHLRHLMLNFVIAGRDTTACTLAWTMYELARPENEEVRAAVVREVDDVLGGQEPTYSDVRDILPYLRGVIYEVLRLHPIVPNIMLIAQGTDRWPDGTVVAAGTMVRIFAYGLCRSAKIYKDPTRLSPERWIPFKAPSPWEYPVFKGGPRLCLGMAMAIFEASLLTAMLLQRFETQLCPGQQLTYSQMVTMSIRNDATMRHELLVNLVDRQA